MTPNMTPATVAAFYRGGPTLAAVAAVLVAREHARETREKVDAYTRPILAAAGLCEADGGAAILESRWLFLCDDDDGCAAFYAACDDANRAHGYELEPGYCPALVAESDLITAENLLIEAASTHYGVDFTRLYRIEARRELLDLLTGGATCRS